MRALAVTLVVLASVASAQVTKTTTTVTVPACGSQPAMHDVDVYRPSGAGPFPLVALGHGFQNDKNNFSGLANALAALGVVVVVPQFPGFLTACGSDHARNGRVLLAAVDQQITAGGIDTSRLGFGGHSAGGLAAFLAAAQRPSAAVMLFDPVDNSTLGANAVAMVNAPTLFVFAEPSTCNSQGNSVPWFASLSGAKARLKVVNANHCDPQEPISSVCTFGCGGANATSTTRQAIFKRYAIAFFDRYLRGVTMPCLEATAQADATAGRVSEVDFRLGGCGGTDGGTTADAGAALDAGSAVDAGAALDAGADAGVVDAGSFIDAGAPTDAGEPDAGNTAAGDADAGLGASPDAGTDVVPVPAGGCGCTSVDPASLFALGLLGLARRRVRSRR